MENLELLVNRLRALPNETTWLEFKHNNYSPDMIGEDISALANSAALAEKNCAYMIWGINDTTHDIVGTEFDQYSKLSGNQEIESWLRNLLSKNAEFEFRSLAMEDKKVVVLIIYKAVSQTVMFKKTDYIRVGSYTKKLVEYPTLQAQLWDRLRSTNFEGQIAKSDMDVATALGLIDHTIYFDLLRITPPSAQDGILHYMLEDGILVLQDDGRYSISNMGAVLFAKRLTDFPRLARKAIRVVQYDGTNRMNILKEEVVEKGYVVGFEGTLKYIEALIPSKEVINGAVREKQTAFPLLAIREVVANALIHQDFPITGTGPVVEIFSNRMEVTNPGIPLVDVFRIIDNPPKSRNEQLASLMRRLKMCEELGTGWDKIVISCEVDQLPAPSIDLYDQSTKVTLYSEMPFRNILPEDRLWACYLHSCIRFVEGEHLTNSSLRARFGLGDSSSGNISRLIKEAVEKKLIKPLDPNTAPRYMRYVPIWA